MKRTLNKVEASKVEILIEFNGLEWKSVLDRNIKAMTKDITIAGFRPGKAPENLLRAQVNNDKLYQRAINDLLPEAYSTSITEEKLIPLSRPSVDVTKVSDTEAEIKITVLLVPEFTLGQYKGLDIKKDAVSISEEEINQEIKSTLANQAELMLKEGPAELGDSVVFDFEGFLEGKPFDGGKADNYTLELGSNQFIPGFESQMVGLKSGESKDLQVKFPDQYQAANLAGKDVVFKVKLHEVKSKKLPVVNAALFETLKLPNVTNEEQFKQHIKTQLTEQKNANVESKYFSDILDSIVKNSNINLPHEAIHHHMDDLQEDLMKRLEQQQQTMEQYLASRGQTQEQYQNELHEVAEKQLLQSLVIDKLAKAENIEVTEQMLDFEMLQIASKYKMELDKVKEVLKPQLGRFRAEIRERYIREFLLKHNN
jgi:trigger factor